MKEQLIYIAFLMMLLIASCDTVHEFPEEEEEEPEEEIIIKNIDIDVSVIVTNITMEKNDGVTDSGSFPQYFSDDVQLRLVCEFWSLTSGELYTTKIVSIESQQVQSKYSFSVDLKLDKYRIVVWHDYVKKNTPQGDFYWKTTDNLKNVLLSNLHAGNTDDLDCFSGVTAFDLNPYKGQTGVQINIPIDIQRPVGRLILVANDLKKYVEKRLKSSTTRASEADILKRISLCTTAVYYQGYTLFGFNAYDQIPNDASAGMSYVGQVQVLNEDEAIIAFNYPLAQSSGTTLHMQLKICDESGNTINEIPDLSIDVKPGKLTVYRFDFLTHEYSNGISIDQNFEGQYDINLPD